MEMVLNHFQQTGKIYVIKERRQSCYHVTVRLDFCQQSTDYSPQRLDLYSPTNI
jgi:hypothetical protein